jgi:hypothetical protein
MLIFVLYLCLHRGEEYGIYGWPLKLLASMVTGSSWETKDGQKRLDKSKKTDLDVSCGFSALIEFSIQRCS